MNRCVSIGVVLLLTLSAVGVPRLVSGAEQALEPQGKIMLFDGKGFDGWVHQLRGTGGSLEGTWSVKPGGILACKGKPSGYIRTTRSYKNYKFHMEYRWPGQTGNNGILVHTQGEDRVWPQSLECQGGYGNQGDFWEIGGFIFNEHKSGGHRVRGRRVLKYGQHNEKEPGQWNVYEVWCVGDTVRPYVNGKLMNEATDCVITEGSICLQSEGVPIEYHASIGRNIIGSGSASPVFNLLKCAY